MNLTTHGSLDTSKYSLSYVHGTTRELREIEEGSKLKIPPMGETIRRFYLVREEFPASGIMHVQVALSGSKSESYEVKVLIGANNPIPEDFNMATNTASASTSTCMKSYDNGVPIDFYIKSFNKTESVVGLNIIITVEEIVEIPPTLFCSIFQEDFIGVNFSSKSYYKISVDNEEFSEFNLEDIVRHLTLQNFIVEEIESNSHSERSFKIRNLSLNTREVRFESGVRLQNPSDASSSHKEEILLCFSPSTEVIEEEPMIIEGAVQVIRSTTPLKVELWGDNPHNLEYYQEHETFIGIGEDDKIVQGYAYYLDNNLTSPYSHPSAITRIWAKDLRSPLEFLSFQDASLRIVQWYGGGYKRKPEAICCISSPFLEAIPNQAPPKTANLGDFIFFISLNPYRDDLIKEELTQWDIRGVSSLERFLKSYATQPEKKISLDFSLWKTSIHTLRNDIISEEEGINNFSVVEPLWGTSPADIEEDLSSMIIECQSSCFIKSETELEFTFPEDCTINFNYQAQSYPYLKGTLISSKEDYKIFSVKIRPKNLNDKIKGLHLVTTRVKQWWEKGYEGFGVERSMGGYDIFAGGLSCLKLPLVEPPNTTDLSYMLGGYGALFKPHYKSLMTWDFTKIRKIDYMLAHYSKYYLTSGLEYIDTSKIESMQGLFYGATSAILSDISVWDVSEVKNMDFLLDYVYRTFNSEGKDELPDDGTVFKALSLKEWCVGFIQSPPKNFSTSGNLPSSDYPVWGTCPRGEKPEDYFPPIDLEGMYIGDEMEVTTDHYSTIFSSEELNITGEGITVNYSYFGVHYYSVNGVGSYGNRYLKITPKAPNSQLPNISFKGLKSVAKWYRKGYKGFYTYNTPWAEGNPKIPPLAPPNTSDFSNMFRGMRDFNADISKWDVSKATKMVRMFEEAESFNQDLSSWDVSNVKENKPFAEGATNWTLPKPNFPPEVLGPLKGYVAMVGVLPLSGGEVGVYINNSLFRTIKTVAGMEEQEHYTSDQRSALIVTPVLKEQNESEDFEEQFGEGNKEGVRISMMTMGTSNMTVKIVPKPGTTLLEPSRGYVEANRGSTWTVNADRSYTTVIAYG